TPDGIAGLEVDEAIGARAHRLQVGRRLARLVALEGLEEVPGDDHASRAAERVEPERRGVLEHELRGVAVDLLDSLDVAVGRDRDRRGRRIARVLPVEDEIVGGERLSVVPADTPLELPDDRLTVSRDATVLERRNLLGQDREEIALGVERRERLVEHARAVLILRADGEVRVEQGRSLPPEHLELAASASTRRREALCTRLGGNPGGAEHLGGQRPGEAETDDDPGERPPRQATGAHVRDETVDLSLVHEVVLLQWPS